MFPVGRGHNSRVLSPQVAVQVAKDILDDRTARLSHRPATHTQDHGLWKDLRIAPTISFFYFLLFLLFIIH